MENGYKIYATSTARSLGEAIAQKLDHQLNLTHVERFSDGELFVRFNESIRGQSIFLIAKVNMPYENFFELLLADRGVGGSVGVLDRRARHDAARGLLTSPVVFILGGDAIHGLGHGDLDHDL
jgi:hypothetical protein